MLFITLCGAILKRAVQYNVAQFPKHPLYHSELSKVVSRPNSWPAYPGFSLDRFEDEAGNPVAVLLKRFSEPLDVPKVDLNVPRYLGPETSPCLEKSKGVVHELETTTDVLLGSKLYRLQCKLCFSAVVETGTPGSRVLASWSLSYSHP